jgi:hypothetical protein
MVATTSAEATLATSHTKPKDKNEAALQLQLCLWKTQWQYVSNIMNLVK